MPTIIDMKGVWSAAHNTQASVHEVNDLGIRVPRRLRLSLQPARLLNSRLRLRLNNSEGNPLTLGDSPWICWKL